MSLWGYFLIILTLSFSVPGQSQISSRSQLQSVFSQFENHFQKHLWEDQKIQLKFNPVSFGLAEDYWWNLETVSARAVFISFDEYSEFSIFVFGGFARLPQMTKDSLRITICHELGHYLSDGPSKHGGGALEGEADYYSTGPCLRDVFSVTKQDSKRSNTDREKKLCGSSFSEEKEKAFCLRAFKALDAQLLFLQLEDPDLEFWSEDSSKAKELNRRDYFYPSPACRLQSMRAGILKLPRPSCWYVEDHKNLERY